MIYDIGVELVKAVGHPYDKHRCFFIKDFNAGDSIRVLSDEGDMVRGLVESIDLDTMEIIYRTKDESGVKAFTNDIVSLERRRANWLEN